MERKNITVDKIMEICEGELISRGKESTINSFCADTRKINVGDIFISLKSEKGLEMQYIKEALQKGARGCITEQDIPTEIIENYKDRIIIKVKDIIYAIQKLAIYKRKMYDIPVIAITGSVGKTSPKDIIANVLKQKFDVAKTEGNYNNHIGVPITILNWRENTNAAVVEMGMNHEGEISVLTNIAKPTIAVITNIGTAHIGFLGSRENILKAKLEILEGLTKNGKIIINNDNDMLSNCKTGEYKKITYGIKNKSNYTAYDINRLDYGSNYKIKIDDKEEEIMVPISGDHFIYNSLCAIAVGRETGIEINKIIEGIRTFSITGERNETKKVNDLIIINDYYNASYDSMKAGLEVLKNIKGKRKIAILGDMLELGDHSEILHKKVGEEVAKNKIDILCTIGDLSKYIAKEAMMLGTKEVYQFKTNKECINKLKKIIKKGDCVLLKSSNKMNFGEISNYLQGESLWKK